jgi:hypothetical protein
MGGGLSIETGETGTTVYLSLPLRLGTARPDATRRSSRS